MLVRPFDLLTSSLTWGQGAFRGSGKGGTFADPQRQHGVRRSCTASPFPPGFPSLRSQCPSLSLFTRPSSSGRPPAQVRFTAAGLLKGRGCCRIEMCEQPAAYRPCIFGKFLQRQIHLLQAWTWSNLLGSLDTTGRDRPGSRARRARRWDYRPQVSFRPRRPKAFLVFSVAQIRSSWVTKRNKSAPEFRGHGKLTAAPLLTLEGSNPQHRGRTSQRSLCFAEGFSFHFTAGSPGHCHQERGP